MPRISRAPAAPSSRARRSAPAASGADHERRDGHRPVAVTAPLTERSDAREHRLASGRPGRANRGDRRRRAAQDHELGHPGRRSAAPATSPDTDSGGPDRCRRRPASRSIGARASRRRIRTSTLILDRVVDQRGRAPARSSPPPRPRSSRRRARSTATRDPVVVPCLRGHHDGHAGGRELAQAGGPLAVGAVRDDHDLRPGRQPRLARASPRTPAQLAAAAGEKRQQRRLRRRRLEVERDGVAIGRRAGDRAAPAAARRARRARRHTAARAGVPAPRRLAATQAAQDLGVAAQQPGDQHEQERQQHGLRRHDRATIRRRLRPPALQLARPGPSDKGHRGAGVVVDHLGRRCSPSHQRSQGSGRSPAGRRPRSCRRSAYCTARSENGCNRRVADCSHRQRTGSLPGNSCPGSRLQSR